MAASDPPAETPTPPPATLTAEQAEILLKADLRNLAKKVQAGKTLSASERNLLQSTLSGGKPSEKTYAKNQADLADILDVSRKTIQRHLKREGNPGAMPDGRYNVHAWRAWLTEHGNFDENEGLSQTQLKSRQILLQNQKLEFQLAVLRKEFIAAADVEKWVGEMIGNAKKKLLAGPPAIAPQVVGVSVAEAESILRDWLHEALSQLHQDPLGVAPSVLSVPSVPSP